MKINYLILNIIFLTNIICNDFENELLPEYEVKDNYFFVKNTKDFDSISFKNLLYDWYKNFNSNSQENYNDYGFDLQNNKGSYCLVNSIGAEFRNSKINGMIPPNNTRFVTKNNIVDDHRSTIITNNNIDKIKKDFDIEYLKKKLNINDNNDNEINKAKKEIELEYLRERLKKFEK